MKNLLNTIAILGVCLYSYPAVGSELSIVRTERSTVSTFDTDGDMVEGPTEISEFKQNTLLQNPGFNSLTNELQWGVIYLPVMKV